MKIINLQEITSLEMHKTGSSAEFWNKYISEVYENCRTLAVNLAIMFGFIYVWERTFSKMDFLMNKYLFFKYCSSTTKTFFALSVQCKTGSRPLKIT